MHSFSHIHALTHSQFSQPSCYHVLLLSANILYKAALQEAGDMEEKEPSVNAPHPYQVTLGIVCLQQVRASYTDTLVTTFCAVLVRELFDEFTVRAEETAWQFRRVRSNLWQNNSGTKGLQDTEASSQCVQNYRQDSLTSHCARSCEYLTDW